MRKSMSGFTIVELLIVIVVIGILAAITVVAYNGISTRAENSKTVSAVNAYVKGILNYSTLNGTYPIDTNFPCLGPTGTTCARRTGTATCTSNPDGAASAQANFISLMQQVMGGSLPQLSSQSVSCSGNTYSGGYYNSAADGKTAGIVYYLKGNEPCNISGMQTPVKVQQENMTRCAYSFSTL